MGAHDVNHQLINNIPVQSVHWYVIGGIVLGSLVFGVAASVVVYRCYRRRLSRSDPNRLSNAIKKGLKEGNNGSLKRTASNKSTASTRSFVSGGSEGKPLVQGQQPDVYIPEKRVSPRTSPSDGIHPGQIMTQCHIENEKNGNTIISVPMDKKSPTEKDVALREKSIDELKIKNLGSLQFAVNYDQPKTALIVTVIRADGLPIKDSNTGSSDPYVKLQLLPEKRHKVKTRMLRKTLNPVFDEMFTFYGIDVNQLQGITLHFVILSFDRFSRDDIIGEVLYPLSGVDIQEQKEISICREISPRHVKIHSQGRGELLVSLCYQPAANRLTVVVLKARNLPKMDITGLSDPYVKIYLLYNDQRIAKKKTHVKKRTLNPVFNESFLFDVPCNEGLQNISLEFQVLDWDRMTKNETVGRLNIGSKILGNEAHHWNEVMNCPRKQIAEWHRLKE